MSWESEFGNEYEVPAIVDYLVKLGFMRDVSWHNDTTPRFEVVDPKNDERGVTLLVDHIIGSERETGPEGKRFLVQSGHFQDDAGEYFETDDLETAILEFFKRADRYYRNGKKPNWPGIVREWSIWETKNKRSRR